MPKILVSELKPQSTRLAGSAIGEKHLQQVLAILDSANSSDQLAIFDFDKVESVTASYLKRLLNPFLAARNSGESIAHHFFPIVVNVEAGDLLEDLEDYLIGKDQALVIAAFYASELHFVRLLGRLDGAASETFDELRRHKNVTAQMLFDLHPDRTTNQTAWNNRLAQLVTLRLAHRHREGRFWIYQPTVTN